MSAHIFPAALCGRRQATAVLVAGAGLLALAGCGDTAKSGGPTPPGAVIRVNQAGYPRDSRKTALLMVRRATAPLRFEVVNRDGDVVLHGRSGRSRGAWSRRWPAVYPLDLTRLREPGRYRIEVGRVRSQPFSVDERQRLYAPVAGATLGFFQAQRDGGRVIPGVLHRAPSHLRDRRALVYRTPPYRQGELVGGLRRDGGPVDLSGGWFDAGDYLKFVETASFVDTMMLFTARDYGSGVADRGALLREARFGAEWLLKTWDQRRGVLYHQVGLGDGNGRSILGDHDFWRLPENDDQSRTRPGADDFFVANRPVFAANAPGQPISPNLAGRTAAAFGLCAQVFADRDPAFARRCLVAGQTLYARADPRPRGLVTATPYEYYEEQEWRDDLELGAIELYLGGLRLPRAGLPHPRAEDYVQQAGRWADAYMASPLSGQDTLNLYDVGALAHHDLHRVLESPRFRRLAAVDPRLDVPTDTSSLRDDLLSQLRLVARRARPDPFHVGEGGGNVDPVPHALGATIAVGLYESMTGRREFEPLAREQFDWVLGNNSWGISFVVGAGSVFPRCLSHQVANLSGSLAGRGKILVGATVDGPTAQSPDGRSAPEGFRRCRRPLAAFDGHGLHYVDDAAFALTSEPADDYTALALTAMAQRASGGAGPRERPAG